jgi:signal transduction histidine kinase
MKHISPEFTQRYMKALLTHIDQGATLPKTTRDLARQVLAAGMTTLELANLHERILLTEVLANEPARRKPAKIRRASDFFVMVITRDETSYGDKHDTSNHKKIITQLSQRVHELTVSKLQLSSEITRRKAVEASLKASEAHYAKSMKDAKFLKERLQALSRQILSMQEEERKIISRDLHDVIAQSLMSINVHLATLKKQAGLNTRDFNRTITSTQRLLAKTAHTVHQFACGLRPPVLDDIGLIAALHAFMIDFSTRSGVRAELTATRKVEKLADNLRTVLFRVAQEALTNVERHAAAGHVKVGIREINHNIIMTITDDGKSFDVQRLLHSRGNEHLGLLGMRERVEMVGGSFEIASSSGHGTTITVSIPLGKALKSRG